MILRPPRFVARLAVALLLAALPFASTAQEPAPAADSAAEAGASKGAEPAGLTEHERRAAALAVVEARAAEGFAKLDLPGMAFGLVRGDELALAKGYGVASAETGDRVTPQTPFQIGSITKVFTASLLLSLRDEGLARLDDPVSLHLPEGTRLPPADPRGAAAISLRHLVQHASSLPGMPPNLTGTETDPYNNYSEEQLLAGLGQVARPDPIGAYFAYSNFGSGLLGYALGRAAGSDYESALRERLLEPLGMNATNYGLEHSTLGGTRGHEGSGGDFAVVPDWSLGVLGPAGAIVSNVEDMAKFMSLQLRAGTADSAVLAGGTLAEAHAPQRQAGGWDQWIGLGWMIDKVDPKKEGTPKGIDRVVWHNGGTSGHNAWAGFSPRAKVGVILLANHGDRRGIDALGKELLLLAAKELAVPAEPPPARVLEAAARLAGCFSRQPSLETLRDLLHPDFMAQIPPEKIGMIFLSIYFQAGKCVRHEVERVPDEPQYFLVRFHMEKGVEPARLVLSFDSPESADGKIIFALFPPPEKQE